MTRALVIGGGSWAPRWRTPFAPARHSAASGADPATVELLAVGRCRQLAALAPVAGFEATTDPSTISDAELVFLVVPVAATAECLRQLDGLAASDATVVLCAKGLVMADGQPHFMTELAANLCPQRPVVIMSGPTFADEVLQGLPAAITAAGHDEAAVTSVQAAFSGSHLRVYAARDPLGVAIGGAMKNVIAIAAGCAAGLGLGDNAKAALITRGLAEMARFATAAGAAPDTIYGLSGAGDLALTCAGPHSRNMAYGWRWAAARPVPKLAEGRHSVAALAARGRALGVELPITDGVDGLVNHGEDLRKVVASLLARPAGAE